uniref:Proteasome assembly chaperone family protein n=1 Tax=Thermofilum pendens TaxID=2269 RepID=A0A7C3SLQ7_THEPE
MIVMEKPWNSFLYEEIPEGGILVIGIPDVGLVGPISTSHLVKMWKLQSVGYFDSPDLPPVILFHDATPLMPMRLYGGYKGNDYVLVLHSDVAIPPQSIHSLASFVVNFSLEKKLRRVFLLGGIAVQERLNIETPKTYAVSVDRNLLLYAQERGVEPLREGFIGGAYAPDTEGGLQGEDPRASPALRVLPQLPRPGRVRLHTPGFLEDHRVQRRHTTTA